MFRKHNDLQNMGYNFLQKIKTIIVFYTYNHIVLHYSVTKKIWLDISAYPGCTAITTIRLTLNGKRGVNLSLSLSIFRESHQMKYYTKAM